MEKRQVFDMPQPRLEVTEHQAHIYTCAGCRGVTKAAFPPAVSAHVQYGPRIKAAAVYLNVQHLVHSSSLYPDNAGPAVPPRAPFLLTVGGLGVTIFSLFCAVA
jgi:hypothetical protein